MSLELWGGVESTVNRVGDEFRDQTVLSGHEHRISDLERFAEIGIRAIRYPVLWERVAPDSLDECDWQWSDERLAKIRSLGMRPIVTLLHHGSGPRYTDLLDPAFPEKLARYARAVAERYPWADAYTPVNEPLTTARFSALYGFWYPHHRDDRSFVRALLNQIKGTILAMREMRHVNPKAELIQTEDLGKVYSTPELQYQADFENERRWLSYDLLTGRMPDGLMRRYLLRHGASSEELEWIEKNAIASTTCGFNHYLSSERFLDHRTHMYPNECVGGNGRDRYVDVFAAQFLPRGIDGAGVLLREAWERYRLPLALTEVHNGCTREDQLRWLLEQWNHCVTLRERGVDIRALTLWSLLGAIDWNTLLIENNHYYEPGVFDVRAPQPRPTAIATLAATLAQGTPPEHPLLETQGWWHRRLTSTERSTGPRLVRNARRPRPVLITGARGTLARAFARICCLRGIENVALSRPELDVADPTSIQAALDRYHPWAVINCAGFVRVDDAEVECEPCLRENAEAVEHLARVCRAGGLRFVTFSSDLVFDGSKQTPYLESDSPNPLNVYGQSKALAERNALAEYPESLVVRTSAFFGPWDEYNFVTIALGELAAGREFVASEQHVVTPTYVPDLVHATLDLLVDEAGGIWHLATPSPVSWFEFAAMAAEQAAIDSTRLRPGEGEWLAPRPMRVPLGSERAWLMPSLTDALRRYLGDCEAEWKRTREALAA